jgi:uncharacterized protein YuzE
MATVDDNIDINYDERGDILYASLGAPQSALSYEITKDIWLDYIPPSQTVVGITILHFLQHYPIVDRVQLLTTAKAVVKELLQTYPTVPSLAGEENAMPEKGIPSHAPKVSTAPSPWLQIYSSAAVGTYTAPLTQSIGLVPLFETPRIRWSQIPVKEETT